MNKELFDFIDRTAQDFDINVRDEDGSICLEFPNDLEFFIEYDSKEDIVEEFECFDNNLYDYAECLSNDLSSYRFDSAAERIELYGVLEIMREFRDKLANDFEYDFT